MILAGLALLGAGGFLFLNEINALPEDLSLPFISAQKVKTIYRLISYQNETQQFLAEKRFSSEGFIIRFT